jgi:hypothetical protein
MIDQLTPAQLIASIVDATLVIKRQVELIERFTSKEFMQTLKDSAKRGKPAKLAPCPKCGKVLNVTKRRLPCSKH